MCSHTANIEATASIVATEGIKQRLAEAGVPLAFKDKYSGSHLPAAEYGLTLRRSSVKWNGVSCEIGLGDRFDDLATHMGNGAEYYRLINNLATQIETTWQAMKKTEFDEDSESFIQDFYSMEIGFVEHLIGMCLIALQNYAGFFLSGAIAFSERPSLDREKEFTDEEDKERERTRRQKQRACVIEKYLGLSGNYRDQDKSLIQFVRALANFYKHRDEWSPESWSGLPAEAPPGGPLRRQRETRELVALMGIGPDDTEPMQKALQFFRARSDANASHSPAQEMTNTISELREEVWRWSRAIIRYAKEEIDKVEMRDRTEREWVDRFCT